MWRLRYLAGVRYRLTIAYDGSAFHGWQKQFAPPGDQGGVALPPPTPLPETGGVAHTPENRRELRTVQGVLDRALRELFCAEITTRGASRTDAGVHARAQCAVFDAPVAADGSRRGPSDERMAEAITSRLPEDVVVTEAHRADDGFDPIGDCLSKGYRYSIVTGRRRPLFDRAFVYHVRPELDERAMHDAAQLLVGTHDFAGLTTLNHGRETTVRTVHACSVVRDDADRLRIDVSGDGFLYNMVRIIAGTLIEVGRGRIDAQRVARALAEGDRRLAGPTMGPSGLCLMWIRYPQPVGVIGSEPSADPSAAAQEAR